MKVRARRILALLAALAAGAAAAQSTGFLAPVPVPQATPPVQLALAPGTAPPAMDLFVGEYRLDLVAGSTVTLYRRGTLAPVVPLPLFGSPLPVGTCFTAGSWSGVFATGDSLADLAFCDPSSDMSYWLSERTFREVWPLTADSRATGLVYARMLDRLDLVLVAAKGFELEIAPNPTSLYPGLRYPSPAFPTAAGTFALQTLRLGDVSRGAGLHDVAWSRVGRPELFVLWTVVASPTYAYADWAGQVVAFAGAAEVRGAGTADADGDGIPDLLAVVVPPGGSGRLLSLHNSGTPVSLDPSAAVDLGAALGLSDPRYAAPLDLDGVPAAAVWDGGSRRIHVVTADPGGGLRSWSAAADPAWGDVTQVLAGDLTGSAAADLVVLFGDGHLQVYPGDLAPSLAWAGSPPAGATTSAPLVLAVDAWDGDGSLAAVELYLDGQPSGIAPVQAGARYTFTVPPSALCGRVPAALATVRATDDVGVWREVGAVVAVSDIPALVLDSGPTRVVPLLPGGTTASLEALGVDGCGRALTFAWTEQNLPAGTQASTISDASSSRLTLVIPEAAYPGMLASPDPSVQVQVTLSVGAGASAGVNLGFDATALVQAEHRSDRTGLAAGELALLTTTLRSRIGLALPQVIVDQRLVGLSPAGEVRLRGAVLLRQTLGPDGLTLTLEALPGGGAPVVVELPVMRTEAPGAASQARAFASGSGLALSQAADAAVPEAPLPGLGCGTGGGSPFSILALALYYMKAMRRVPARTRSTSSSRPMRRQA